MVLAASLLASAAFALPKKAQDEATRPGLPKTHQVLNPWASKPCFRVPSGSGFRVEVRDSLRFALLSSRGSYEKRLISFGVSGPTRKPQAHQSGFRERVDGGTP